MAYCDPIPHEQIAELLASAEPARRAVVLHSAWRNYADRASRPYSWKTFEEYARRQAVRAGCWPRAQKPKRVDVWGERAAAVPHVLVVGPYAALRVRGGALEIEHGPHSDRQTVRIDVDADPKPHSILFDSHGEFLTGEAMRFCARYGIGLVFPGGPGRLITAVETYAEARDKKGATKRDLDPAILLAQCAAALDEEKSLAIAREIVRRKIEAQALALKAHPAAQETVRQWGARIDATKTLNEVLIVEGHAAAAYWRVFREMGLRERKGGNLPRSWMRYPQRTRGRPAFREGVGGGPENASHPINAMLNYAYVVEAGRLVRALTARGLILPLGFLHKPKRGRNSLVWDAIEPLRPMIDARVFAFVAEHEFARSDFPQSAYNVHRLSRSVTQLLLHHATLPSGDIEETADWMARVVTQPG